MTKTLRPHCARSEELPPDRPRHVLGFFLPQKPEYLKFKAQPYAVGKYQVQRLPFFIEEQRLENYTRRKRARRARSSRLRPESFCRFRSTTSSTGGNSCSTAPASRLFSRPAQSAFTEKP